MQLLPFLLVVWVFLQSSSSTTPTGQAQNWFQQAQQHFEKQEWDKSRLAAARALEIDPTLADAEVLLGLVATAQARLPEAEKHLRRAVSLQPRNDRAQGYLASVYLQEKRFGEASQALQKVLAANKRLHTAYLLKESFGQLWSYQKEGWARRFFDKWRAALKWQRLKPYEQFAEMIERHWDGIAAFCHPENKVALGFVEGLNNKIRVIQRRAYGLRDEEYLRLKILTCMLPEL